MKVWLWGIFLILRLPKWQVLRRHWPWYIAFSLAWTLVHLNSKVAMSRVIIKSINTNLSVKLNLLLIEKHSQNTRDTQWEADIHWFLYPHRMSTSSQCLRRFRCPRYRQGLQKSSHGHFLQNRGISEIFQKSVKLLKDALCKY